MTRDQERINLCSASKTLQSNYDYLLKLLGI